MRASEADPGESRGADTARDAEGKSRGRAEPSLKAKEKGIQRQLASLPALVAGWLAQRAAGGEVRLRPSTILDLHRFCTLDCQPEMGPGMYRNRQVRVRRDGGHYIPPHAQHVPALVEQLCDLVNAKWQRTHPGKLVAYVLYLVNWIHPFLDGNGRVGRALAYAIMCNCLGRDPGLVPLLSPQFAHNRTELLSALRSADSQDGGRSAVAEGEGGLCAVSLPAWGSLDLAALEAVLCKIWPPLRLWPEGGVGSPATAAALALSSGAGTLADVTSLRASLSSSGAAFTSGPGSGRGDHARGRPLGGEMDCVREQLQCMICHDLLLDPVTAPRCGHSFCTHCIVTWCRRCKPPACCPSCRARLPPESELVVVSVTLKNLVQQMFPAEIAERAAHQRALPPAAEVPNQSDDLVVVTSGGNATVDDWDFDPEERSIDLQDVREALPEDRWPSETVSVSGDEDSSTYIDVQWGTEDYADESYAGRLNEAAVDGDTECPAAPEWLADEYDEPTGEYSFALELGDGETTEGTEGALSPEGRAQQPEAVHEVGNTEDGGGSDFWGSPTRGETGSDDLSSDCGEERGEDGATVGMYVDAEYHWVGDERERSPSTLEDRDAGGERAGASRDPSNGSRAGRYGDTEAHHSNSGVDIDWGDPADDDGNTSFSEDEGSW